jgi:hypothetical protein
MEAQVSVRGHARRLPSYLWLLDALDSLIHCSAYLKINGKGLRIEWFEKSCVCEVEVDTYPLLHNCRSRVHDLAAGCKIHPDIIKSDKTLAGEFSVQLTVRRFES